MEYLEAYERPNLTNPTFLFAFAGWADAAESATHALRYLVEQLGATKFASVGSEEFYNFARVRPHSQFDSEGNREIVWPANDFFAWKGGPASSDLAIFIGIEPNLRWRTFTKQIVGVVKELGVSKAVNVGALLDAVPHTRDPRITGTALRRDAEDPPRAIERRRSGYTGPMGISAVVGEALRQEGVPLTSLWGHAPHYLQVEPNPKVSLALLRAMEGIVPSNLDLEPLRSEGRNFDQEVAQALSDESAVSEYVQRLEAQYDSSSSAAVFGPAEMPEPEEAVRGMEEFLRQLRDDQSAGRE